MSCLQRSDSYQECFSKWGFSHIFVDCYEREFAFSYRKTGFSQFTFIYLFSPPASVTLNQPDYLK